MIPLSRHLGSSVAALVDGQLDEAAQERAWAHVAGCQSCHAAVERERWTKRQLGLMAGGEPSARLLGSLFELDASHPSFQMTASGSAPPASTSPSASSPSDPDHGARNAWAAVTELESQGRGRRRAGLAAVGVGSVSAAVFGLSSLSGALLGIGSAPAGTPTAPLTGSTSTPSPSSAPTAWRVPSRPGSRGSTPWWPSGHAEPVSVASSR